MKVDRYVVFILPLVNIDIHANPWVVFFYDPSTPFLYYDRRRRGRGHDSG
jgi:hypothetical protein